MKEDCEGGEIDLVDLIGGLYVAEAHHVPGSVFKVFARIRMHCQQVLRCAEHIPNWVNPRGERLLLIGSANNGW